MTGIASVHVDLTKIVQNTHVLTGVLPGVDIVGVTKVTGGSPAVARALLAGGAKALADSRLVNIARMRAHGVEARYWLLRAPAPQQADEVVKLADVSLESEIRTVRALSSRTNTATCAATSAASWRKAMGVVPAWLDWPSTVNSVHEMPCTPSTTPICKPICSSTGPCSMCSST